MSLSNIKAMKSERGFTIVELLIVVVIIGILAAIVIVAYNGVTNRAKTSKAQATASSLVKKFETYNAEQGSYPSAYTQLTGAASTTSYYIPPSAYTLSTTAVTSGSTETTFNAVTCTALKGGGIAITVFDYSAGSAKDYFVGGCTDKTGGTTL